MGPALCTGGPGLPVSRRPGPVRPEGCTEPDPGHWPGPLKAHASGQDTKSPEPWRPLLRSAGTTWPKHRSYSAERPHVQRLVHGLRSRCQLPAPADKPGLHLTANSHREGKNLAPPSRPPGRQRYCWRGGGGSPYPLLLLHPRPVLASSSLPASALELRAGPPLCLSMTPLGGPGPVSRLSHPQPVYPSAPLKLNKYLQLHRFTAELTSFHVLLQPSPQ